MRRLVPLALVILTGLSCPVYAQQATLTTPVARPSEHNLRVESVFATRDAGGRWEAVVSVRDSGGTVEIRRESYSGPDAAHPGATALAFITAQITARSGETGSNARRVDFRVLGFLADQGYLPAVTLVP